jgi:hypothetical protein
MNLRSPSWKFTEGDKYRTHLWSMTWLLHRSRVGKWAGAAFVKGSMVSQNFQTFLAVTVTYLLYISMFSLLCFWKHFRFHYGSCISKFSYTCCKWNQRRGKIPPYQLLVPCGSKGLWQLSGIFTDEFSLNTAQCVWLKTYRMLQRLALFGRRKGIRKSYFLQLSSETDHKENLHTRYILFQIETQNRIPQLTF